MRVIRALGVLGLVLAAGCSGSRPGIDAPVTVLLVGDSILAQAADETRATLEAAGWIVVTEAHSGSTLAGDVGVESWPARVRELVAEHAPDVVVVELGTNGCGTCESIDAAIDALMTELGAVAHVYWLNVKEEALVDAPEVRDALREAIAVNDALRAATDRWPHLEILDMHGRFSGKDELLAPLGVHLSPEGERELATWLRDRLPKVETNEPRAGRGSGAYQ